jgi:protein-disulfide isomerase
MSSRAQEKARAREARMKAEAAEAAKATRMRRLRILGSLVAVAVVVVVVAIVASSGGGSKTPTKANAGAVTALFAGIPENGMTLGDPKAPITVEEFIDPKCPFCGEFSRTALPGVIENYVRPGKVKLVMRPRTFIGPDSHTAAATAIAASFQNKAWPFMDAFYANQGPENSGYVSDDFLKTIGAEVKGLDTVKALNGRDDPKVADVLNESESRAEQFGLSSTPSFLATKGNGAPKILNLDALTYDSFKAALDKAFPGV